MMARLRGTRHDDDIKALFGIDEVRAGRGDDHVFLFNALDSRMFGGEGHDVFEFRVFEDQTYQLTRDDDTALIVIEGDGYHQEIILRGFEEIVVHELDF